MERLLSDAVLAKIEEQGPLTLMELAAELDQSYRAIQGACLSLIRAGSARWYRGKLKRAMLDDWHAGQRPLKPATIVPFKPVAANLGLRVRFERRMPYAPRQQAGFRELCAGKITWLDATHCLVELETIYAYHPENPLEGRTLPVSRGALECIEIAEIVDGLGGRDTP